MSTWNYADTTIKIRTYDDLIEEKFKVEYLTTTDSCSIYIGNHSHHFGREEIEALAPIFYKIVNDHSGFRTFEELKKKILEINE